MKTLKFLLHLKYENGDGGGAEVRRDWRGEAEAGGDMWGR